ncbi:MAG TPA: SCO family protein [Bacillota bacterium]
MSRVMPKELILLVLLAMAFLAALGWRQVAAERAPRGLRVEAGPAPDFTLTAHTGDPYRLAADDGRVRVVTFGYTHCPDVCPGTLLAFRRAHEQLGADAEHHVRFLFITVDPERDTAARLAEYMPRFHPAFLGLTGDRSALQRVWTRYGIYVEQHSGNAERDSYDVTHTALTYLVDPHGRLRLTHAFGMSAEDLAHDIRLLLREARKGG